MTSCDCSLATNDFDGPAFTETKIVKARKQHLCCECQEYIEPGKQYECTSGLWDGSFSRFATCLPCMRIRKHYCPHGWIYGELRNTLIECLDFDYLDPDYEPRFPVVEPVPKRLVSSPMIIDTKTGQPVEDLGISIKLAKKRIKKVEEKNERK